MRQGSGAGELLAVDPTDGSTNLRERAVSFPGPVRVQPFGIAFVELLDAAAKPCMQ